LVGSDIGGELVRKFVIWFKVFALSMSEKAKVPSAFFKWKG